MASRSRYVENPGWAKRCVSERQGEQVLEQRAQHLVSAIVAAEPVRTGAQQRFAAATTHAEGKTVTLGDPLWHIIERGSIHNPPYAPIRKAVAEMQMRFEDTRG
jgi:hypothetical protein